MPTAVSDPSTEEICWEMLGHDLDLFGEYLPKVCLDHYPFQSEFAKRRNTWKRMEFVGWSRHPAASACTQLQRGRRGVVPLAASMTGE